MSAMSDSLTVVEPIDLVPRRRFSRLTEPDALALAREVEHANERLPALKHDYLTRHPERAL